MRLVYASIAAGFVLAAALPGPAPAAPVAPPDTGIFAPVAAQQARRIAALESSKAAAPTPELVTQMLEAGRVGDAAAALARMTGDARAGAIARARVHLTRLDFAAAQPILERIIAQAGPTDPERRLRFAWLFLHDDAAAVDRLTRGLSLAPGTTAGTPELLAAGRLAHDLLDFARAESCYTRALERTPETPALGSPERSSRAEALVGLGKVVYRRRDYDGALKRYQEAMALDATPDVLRWTSETLIRQGRTDEAISATEWAVRLNPYHESSHYTLGNGYARKNYTQLAAAYPGAFADSAGRRALAQADARLAGGDRSGARADYEAVRRAHPRWADATVRLASLDFEDGRYVAARDRCFEAIAQCPEYGRAHATLAKALESQRFEVDVHRADYERRFAATPMPEVPGIEKFVINWRSLSTRHQKRVALSVAPWKQFIPVLVEGASTYYIKPLYMLLSETPGQETLRDTRINYDSRLWDDVRGAGGYHTVTGIEDVERTIFDRYNTVLHELSHQVHAVLTADQSREIQDLYVKAKARDTATKPAYLSRYAGGSVYEYLAEGANAWCTPKRDAYDPREEVRERLDTLDPDLRERVKQLMAITDVSASYPVAYSNAGDDELGRGRVEESVVWYRKALARDPREETALRSLASALTLGNRRAEAIEAGEHAVEIHPTSGPVVSTGADALWHGGRGLDASIALLEKSRSAVRAEDRYTIDLALSQLHWTAGNAARSLAAADSVIAYQSDQPEGLWRRAAALALDRRWDDAFAAYDRAVRMRTGIAALRCDYARDLLRAGRVEAARAQLAEAQLLDEENATAEALRGWAAHAAGDTEGARRHLSRSLEWGPWCDLARIVLGTVETRSGGSDAARTAWAPVRERIEKKLPPEYVFRPRLATWESVHELPAVERELLTSGANGSRSSR